MQPKLYELARQAENSDERCAYVLALGDLSIKPVEFLQDPSEPVRLCAAMARAFDKDLQVNASMITLLERHARNVNDWFDEIPPQLRQYPRFSAVQTILRRSQSFDVYARAAVAVVATTDIYSSSTFDLLCAAQAEWGPLLEAAFPKGDGVVETDLQRAILKALVDNDVFWKLDYASGARRYFEKAGLPYDREACRASCAMN